MFCLRNPVDRLHKCLPTTALRGQNLLALGRQAVIAPAALAALFHPSPLNPSAFLQALEQWIEGGNTEANGAAGALLNEFGNLVAVSRPGLDQRQDQKLRTDFLPLDFWRHGSLPHMAYPYNDGAGHPKSTSSDQRRLHPFPAEATGTETKYASLLG